MVDKIMVVIAHKDSEVVPMLEMYGNEWETRVYVQLGIREDGESVVVYTSKPIDKEYLGDFVNQYKDAGIGVDVEVDDFISEDIDWETIIV
jgi:CxxC motif-containing protein